MESLMNFLEFKNLRKVKLGYYSAKKSFLFNINGRWRIFKNIIDSRQRSKSENEVLLFFEQMGSWSVQLVTHIERILISLG